MNDLKEFLDTLAEPYKIRPGEIIIGSIFKFRHVIKIDEENSQIYISSINFNGILQNFFFSKDKRKILENPRRNRRVFCC